MIVWKLATRPATAIRPSIEAEVPEPKIVCRPSSSGSSFSASVFEPGSIPELRNRTRKPVTISVRRPQIVPFGMSFDGVGGLLRG
jgi:hypothetical protein